MLLLICPFSLCSDEHCSYTCVSQAHLDMQTLDNNLAGKYNFASWALDYGNRAPAFPTVITVLVYFFILFRKVERKNVVTTCTSKQLQDCSKPLQNTVPATTSWLLSQCRLLRSFSLAQQLKAALSLPCLHFPHNTAPEDIRRVSFSEKQPLGFLCCFQSKIFFFLPSHLSRSILSPQDSTATIASAVLCYALSSLKRVQMVCAGFTSERHRQVCMVEEAIPVSTKLSASKFPRLCFPR